MSHLHESFEFEIPNFEWQYFGKFIICEFFNRPCTYSILCIEKAWLYLVCPLRRQRCPNRSRLLDRSSISSITGPIVRLIAHIKSKSPLIIEAPPIRRSIHLRCFIINNGRTTDRGIHSVFSILVELHSNSKINGCLMRPLERVAYRGCLFDQILFS